MVADYVQGNWLPFHIDNKVRGLSPILHERTQAYSQYRDEIDIDSIVNPISTGA